MISLNRRVLLSAVLVLAVFIVLTAAALDRAFHDSAMAAERERMLGTVFMLMGAAEVSDEGVLSMPGELPIPELAQPGSGRYAYVLGDQAGGDGMAEILWRSPSTLGMEKPLIPRLGPGRRRFMRTAASKDFHFIQAFGVRWNTPRSAYDFTFAVVSDPSAFLARISVFRRTLWTWLGAMALLLLIAQAAIIRWGLRPLRRVVGELNAIESGGLDRVQGRYPPELQLLTDNINKLLGHERARQARYRDALADLAHSLKTPLAMLRGALGENRDRADMKGLIEEEVGRMDGIVNYQLQRAATAGRSSVARLVELRPLAEKIISTMNKVHADKPVEVSMDMAPDIRARIDEGDLTELLGNLLDNAFKWCRGRVRLTAGPTDAGQVISVEDDGPGIAPGQADALLRRGVRADQSMPGHGIGLAIVRDIVHAYEGEMKIDRSGLGGAAVRVRLPV